MICDKIYHLHRGKASCALDLGDGSERGNYVNQDYILNRLGRLHRAISLMYCYYPLDEGWPLRASLAHAKENVNFAWDYPYDDYFPYTGGIGGSKNSETFECMRDIRRHGQDVLLTLTIDPRVSDEHLLAIARDLSTFGRVMLRINHEATGNWFSFNKRCSYQEVADFFVRASNVIKKEATNVKTIICIGGIENLKEEKMVMEDEFAQTITAADIWSVDKYMALHWGWPYDIAEPGGSTHKRDTVDYIYNATKKSFLRFAYLNNGTEKPMVMSEFNADGDVTGPYDQCTMAEEFVHMLKTDERRWLSGISFYQFRDRGRLGLEIEDPNHQDVGIEQPIMNTYRNMLNDPYFMPEEIIGSKAELPIRLRWGGAEDADGCVIPIKLEAEPHFFEVYFHDELQDANFILEVNGRYFYKAPGIKCIDMMPAFFGKHLNVSCELQVKLYAPPATGENDPSQGEGWENNYYYELKKLPEFRILYGPIIR